MRESRRPAAAGGLSQKGAYHAGCDRDPRLNERVGAPAIQVDPDPGGVAVLRGGHRCPDLLSVPVFEKSSSQAPEAPVVGRATGDLRSGRVLDERSVLRELDGVVTKLPAKPALDVASCAGCEGVALDIEDPTPDQRHDVSSTASRCRLQTILAVRVSDGTRYGRPLSRLCRNLRISSLGYVSPASFRARTFPSSPCSRTVPTRSS